MMEGEIGTGSKGWAESAPPSLFGVGLTEMQNIGGDQNQKMQLIAGAH